jgi:hypothetical protein
VSPILAEREFVALPESSAHQTTALLEDATGHFYMLAGRTRDWKVTDYQRPLRTFFWGPLMSSAKFQRSVTSCASADASALSNTSHRSTFGLVFTPLAADRG